MKETATIIMRQGKTQRDRENSCGPRNAGNKGTRTAWMRGEMKEPNGDNPFPKHTCNGKRNRLVRGR